MADVTDASRVVGSEPVEGVLNAPSFTPLDYILGLGWSLVITNTRTSLRTGSTASAVEVGAELAEEILASLRTQGLAGPVIALPETPAYWVLLTGPVADLDHDVVDELEAQDVIVHHGGSLVPLPPTHLECGPVTWKIPPTRVDPYLPPFSAIAAAIRSVTHLPGLH